MRKIVKANPNKTILKYSNFCNAITRNNFLILIK